MVTDQLQVERRTEKVRRSQTNVLPLCHATNYKANTVEIYDYDSTLQLKLSVGIHTMLGLYRLVDVFHGLSLNKP